MYIGSLETRISYRLENSVQEIKIWPMAFMNRILTCFWYQFENFYYFGCWRFRAGWVMGPDCRSPKVVKPLLVVDIWALWVAQIRLDLDTLYCSIGANGSED